MSLPIRSIALALLLFPIAAPRALAHGATPAVLSIAAENGSGVSALQLTSGLALHDGQRFRYLCPALWGDDNSWPAAALPGQPIIVAGSSGLYVVDASGNTARHPDPAGARPGIGLTIAGSQLFLLSVDDSGSTSLASVDPQHVATLWSDAQSWQGLAGDRDFIELLRADLDTIYAVKLSLDGKPLESATLHVPGAGAYLSARAAGGAMYAVASVLDGLVLGRIEAGMWHEVATARAQIAGPIARDGQIYVGLDGELGTLDGEHVTLLHAAGSVSCLGQDDSRSYACTQDGLYDLTVSGIGNSLFELADLAAPALERVAPELRDRCDLQWQHFTFDLLSLGIRVNTASVSMPGVSVAALAGSAAPVTAGASAGMASSAGQIATANSAMTVGALANLPRENSADRAAGHGCSMGAPSHVQSPAWLQITWLALCFWLQVRRRLVATR